MSTNLAEAAAPGTPDPELIDDLVAANRILSDHGVLDAYGHVSARDRMSPQHYWISRSMPPARRGLLSRSQAMISVAVTSAGGIAREIQ